MKWSKNEIKEAMRLYAVTDSAWLNGRSLQDVTEEALKGGVTFLQIREKELDLNAFEQLARALKEKADAYHVPFVVNDEVELAKRIDADGVHIGQSDMELQNARQILGPEKIIGVSVQTVEQAVKAEKLGADYLGVGAVFATSTKTDAADVSLEMLQNICEAVTIPVVAIGGISTLNMHLLNNTGIDGVAVVSAIFASADIEQAAKELKELTDKLTS